MRVYNTDKHPKGEHGISYGRVPVDSIADLKSLAPLLENRRYSRDDISSIFYANWLRYFRQFLPIEA